MYQGFEMPRRTSAEAKELCRRGNAILDQTGVRCQLGGKESIVTRDKIRTAINEGIPFVIRMADGEKYEITDRYRVALGSASVIVAGEDDMPHILPLLTMTGISYVKPRRKSSE